MRVPYVDETTLTESADREIVERIRARRAPKPIQPLDKALLQSPPVADGWNSFLGAIRTRTTLPAAVRELIICRVAICNDAWYEWDDHAPLAIKGGVSADAMDLVKVDDLSRITAESRERADLGDKEWAAIVMADEMTRHVKVKEETFELLREEFTEREVVEVVATASCYNCVSRFLLALDVGEKNSYNPKAAENGDVPGSPQAASF